MMKIKTIALLIIAILLLPNIQASNVTVDRKSEDNVKEWTYMVYCGGDDVDWGAEEITDLMVNFVMNLTIPSNSKINAVVLYDWGQAFYAYLNQSRPLRSNIEIIEEYEEQNFKNYTTLRDFILTCKNDFPANRYFLHIHGHGMGWYGMVFDDEPGDDSKNDCLTMAEIKKAINESGGVDILETTNCNMGSFESAYGLRNITKYYIASEEVVNLFTPFIAVINNIKMLQRNHYKSTDFIAKKTVNTFKKSHFYSFSPIYIVLGLINNILSKQRVPLSTFVYDGFTMSAIRTDKIN